MWIEYFCANSCAEQNMSYQLEDINADTVEQQIKNMCDARVLEISKELIKGKHLTEFEKFFKSLEFETIGRLTESEDFLQVFLKYKLLQGCWVDVIEILKTRQHFSKPVFLNLWDEANYQKYQEESKGNLTPLRRYRLRQQNPPPGSICPSGFRPSRLLPITAVSLLQKWFNAHKDFPYPCKTTKARMARSAGITVKKVTTWFQNARRKYQRKLLQDSITDSSTNLPSTSQQLNTKCSTLHPITPRPTCDVATQSETVIIINDTETCNEPETIDHQKDCGSKSSHLYMDETNQDNTAEERQADQNSNLTTNWEYSNPEYSVNHDIHSVDDTEIVSNCQQSFNVDEQKHRDHLKDLAISLNVMTGQHSTKAHMSQDKGYSWQRANHSQTLSAEWRDIEDLKVTNEDFEWKNIDVCNTKKSKCETAASDPSNIGFTGHAIDGLNKCRKPEQNKPSEINKCKVKAKTKLAGISNSKKSGTIHPVSYKSRQGKHVKISQKMKHTLKTCIEKGKGQNSFLVCKKCNEVVQDAGIKSLQSLQELCEDIESNVQSPVEHVAQMCLEMDSETEELLGYKEDLSFVRSDINLPLDMRMESRPIDLTKENEINDFHIDNAHFASRNQTALFEAEHCPVCIAVPLYRDEIQPINMQVTYEIDRYGPINVHITPESDVRPVLLQQSQYYSDQNTFPELEGSYGRVVAEAIEGLLNMGSSQEFD